MIYKVNAPSAGFTSKIELDGSKSITNRALICQALASGESKLTNASHSDDSLLLQSFFAHYPEIDYFNVNNAGTVCRFLTAFLSVAKGDFLLDCAPPMKNRPIALLVDALASLGADIEYQEKEGFLPLQIRGKELSNNKVTIPAGISSQYISALMMIGPTIPGGLEIELDGDIASEPYLEITEVVMKEFKADIQRLDKRYLIQPSGYKAVDFHVESDWSAAAFYCTMVVLGDSNSIALSYLKPFQESSQGDSRMISLYEQLGLLAKFTDNEIHLSKSQVQVDHIEVDFFDIPDLLPAFAVACAGLGVSADFKGVTNLTIKESNRLIAMKTELAKVGVIMSELNSNHWTLSGSIDHSKLKNTVFDTYEDHRIAMALACVSVLGEEVSINEPSVVSKSYPLFWEDLKTLGFRIGI